MAAQTRAQVKTAVERKQCVAREQLVMLRSGRVIAKIGRPQFVPNTTKRKRETEPVRKGGNEGSCQKRRKLNTPASGSKSGFAVLNPLPSLHSAVSYTPGVDTLTSAFQKNHALHLDRLRRSETSIHQQSILESDLLSNRFYCTYLLPTSNSFPTLSEEQSKDCTSFDAEQAWMDDDVVACRVVPLLNRPLSGIFNPEFLHLQPSEEQALVDIAVVNLYDLEFNHRVKSYGDNPFKNLFIQLQGILWGNSLNERRGRKLFQSLSKPIFDCNVVGSEVTCKLNFDWLRGRIDDSLPLAGKRVYISRHHDVLLSAVDVSDPLVDNPVSVVNFFFQMNEPLRVPAVYAKAFQHWNAFRGDVRDNRKHPNKYREVNPAIPSRTPTPPPIPTQSEYLETQKIPSTACYAAELKLMLAQISANAREYGVGDHDAIVVGMTNLRMHFSVAFFPADHIRNAMEKAVLPRDSLVYFLQSEEYDLATVDGRRGALTGVIALTKFLLSGKAKIGRLQKYFSHNPVHPSTP